MAIQAHELRIGNWVYSEDTKIPYQVDAYGILVIQNSPDNRSPIPLSPEILEKVGRKYSREDNNWEYEISVGAIKWFFRWNIEWYSEIGGIYIDSKVQYLHQLQNLYYSLVGRELEIKM